MLYVSVFKDCGRPTKVWPFNLKCDAERVAERVWLDRFAWREWINSESTVTVTDYDTSEMSLPDVAGNTICAFES